jgi:hypothetical protein
MWSRFLFQCALNRIGRQFVHRLIAESREAEIKA